MASVMHPRMISCLLAGVVTSIACAAGRSRSPLWQLLVICIFIVGFGTLAQAAKAESSYTLFGVDLICDPSQDTYRFIPINIPNLDLPKRIKAEPRLKEMAAGGAIYLNGKFVAHKVFTHSCPLSKVRIDTTLDYNRAQTPSTTKYYCGDEIPDEFKEFAKEHDQKCVAENSGNIKIWYASKQIAYINLLPYELASITKKISFENNVYYFCLKTTQECISSMKLEHLIEDPIFWKSSTRSF